jgi:3-methyladenine DNA glycosylase AlkD
MAAPGLTCEEILAALQPLGSDGYKRVLFNHGIQEPCYGVKISDLQPWVKKIKKDYQLALQLYRTGIYDAMYLAGLIADDARMTPADLQSWVEQAYCAPLSGTTVANVAAGSSHAKTVALDWLDSPRDLTAVAGWATLSALVSVRPDDQLDLPALTTLVHRVERTIHTTPDLVRYQMNAFLIAVGCYVKPLTEAALEAAGRIGPVTADLGKNACKVPSAVDSIRKVEARGTLGKKRKSAKC